MGSTCTSSDELSTHVDTVTDAFTIRRLEELAWGLSRDAPETSRLVWAMARDGRRTAALMAVQPVATDADATHWGGSSGRRRWRYSHWIEAPVLWGSSVSEKSRFWTDKKSGRKGMLLPLN